jgi:hypothetical protein
VTGLTSGRIPIAGTAGLLGDDADLTFSGDTLTATKLAVSTSASIPSITSDVAVGSAAAGSNLTVNSTETESITSPMVAGGWTLGTDGTGGWGIAAGVLSKTTSAGTQTATAVTGMTITPTAGTKYLVTAVVSAASGTTTWTLGGTTIPSITAAGTFPHTVTADTTAKLILSGVAASTVTITSLSVKEITTTAGNATVKNDLMVGRVLAKMGSVTYPGISFSGDTNTGFWSQGSDVIRVALAGVDAMSISGSALNIYSATAAINLGDSDTRLVRDGAAQTLALRNSGNQQVFRIYNTSDATLGVFTNYERSSWTGVAGASVNWTAETSGTGGDNLDMVLTPAGTGRIDLPNGTYHTYLKTSIAEGLVGADFRIGLDETNRTMIICDSGDIATDLGLTARTDPMLAIYSASASSSIRISATMIDNSGTLNIRGIRADTAAGSNITFDSDTGVELTDTDGRQAWIAVSPKVNQSATAAFDGIYVNATLTGVGDGTTGDGNNLLNLAVSGTSQYRVTTGGVQVFDATPDVVSAAGAISVTTPITHVVTNGAGTVLTLAAGVEGQIKFIVLKTLTSGGQTDVVTPDGGGAGFTTITMDAVGDACTLLYTNAKWTIVGSYSCTIA